MPAMEFPSPLLKDARVRRVLDTIEALRLPHPSGPLLSQFIQEALDPIVAASYITNRLSSSDTRNALSLVSDWVYIVECVIRSKTFPTPPDDEAKRYITRRDGGRCCITGRSGSIFDPLCVMPILPIPVGWVTEQKEIFEMLGAFFGAPYRDWWLSYIRHQGHLTPYGNHWLVRRSAGNAFANGSICLRRKQPSMIEYEIAYLAICPGDPIQVDGNSPLLGDHSRLGLSTTDARIIGTHARLCSSIQYLAVARRIAPELSQDSRLPPNSAPLPSCPAKRPIQRKSSAFSPLKPITTGVGNVLLRLWVLMPGPVRIAAYKLLQKLGKSIYGSPNGHSAVQRLPFGLYLRYRGLEDTCLNEFNALQLIRRHTTVPVPKPLDVVTDRTKDSQEDEDDRYGPPMHLNSYLLITRLPGIPLSSCYELLSDSDQKRIISQMQDYLTQLRSIPTLSIKDASICNTLGGPCRDPRVCGQDQVGPFADEAAFSQLLRFSDEPSRRGHRIVFTHADLNPRNILVEEVEQQDGSLGWTVTGIIDWEFSGYYPEYWDYTKALFESFRWTKRYNELVHEIFKVFGDYSREFDVERRSWKMGDGI